MELNTKKLICSINVSKNRIITSDVGGLLAIQESKMKFSYPKKEAVIGEDCGITVVFYSHREVLSSVPKSKKHFVAIKPGILKQITKTV